jgi:hypothetical protein
MTIYMWIATVAWLCLISGYLARKKRSLHVTLMRTGIFLDIGLVLFLQFTRGAIQTALSFELALLKQLHIAASTIALLLYFPILYLGFQLLKGRGTAETRALHIKVGTTALFFRTLGFLLMFSMWKSVAP